MLSYRHGFHAGNHADVLKHFTLYLLLKKLREKAKPFTYFDTHSGAGQYALSDTSMQKNKEYLSGLTPVLNAEFKDDNLLSFQDWLKTQFEDNCYPGSPYIALSQLRKGDKCHLLELHQSEVAQLRQNVRHTGAAVHHRDGFEGLLALTPPTPKRGVALIDPSYELTSDYTDIVSTVTKVLSKWPIGIIAIWYPLLSSRAATKTGQSEIMLTRLAKLAPKNMLIAELYHQANTDDVGMYGSGMAVLNAPWKLDAQLDATLPELAKYVSDTGSDLCCVKWLVTEN